MTTYLLDQMDSWKHRKPNQYWKRACGYTLLTRAKRAFQYLHAFSQTPADILCAVLLANWTKLTDLTLNDENIPTRLSGVPAVAY